MIIFSYVPQLHRIINRGSTFGIAPNYILFNALFTATQLSTILLLSCYHYPVLRCIGDNQLTGLDAYGAVLGLVQITALWLGSVLLYEKPAFIERGGLKQYLRLIVFVIYPNIINEPADDSPPKTLATHVPSSTQSHPEPNIHKAIALICITHALLWLVPAIGIALPRPKEPRMDFAPFIGLCDMICIPASLILVISQFPSQITMAWAMRRQLAASSLSIWTLAVQMIAFILLGVSWIYRLGVPGTGFNRAPAGITDPFTWYYIVSWPYINNIIYGVGQGVLFSICAYYSYKERTRAPASFSGVGSGQQTVSERTSLLGEL